MFRLVDILEFRAVGDGLDSRLERSRFRRSGQDHIVIAGGDDGGAELKALRQMHGADGNAWPPRGGMTTSAGPLPHDRHVASRADAAPACGRPPRPRAPGKGSRTASWSGVGAWTSVRSPARSSSARFRAARQSVFTRSPGLRGISAGAAGAAW